MKIYESSSLTKFRLFVTKLKSFFTTFNFKRNNIQYTTGYPVSHCVVKLLLYRPKTENIPNKAEIEMSIVLYSTLFQISFTKVHSN